MNIRSLFRSHTVIRQGVDISAGSFWFSLLGTFILVGLAWYSYSIGNSLGFYASGGVLVLLCLLMLIYMPMYISIEDDALYVNRSFWFKQLHVADIESIKLMQPTMGARLICGSNGFWGYWGWFREADLGKYFAYYGKASDCFFVKMRDGRQYMLGCKNPGSIVDYVKS